MSPGKAWDDAPYLYVTSGFIKSTYSFVVSCSSPVSSVSRFPVPFVSSAVSASTLIDKLPLHVVYSPYTADVLGFLKFDNFNVYLYPTKWFPFPPILSVNVSIFTISLNILPELFACSSAVDGFVILSTSSPSINTCIFEVSVVLIADVSKYLSTTSNTIVWVEFSIFVASTLVSLDTCITSGLNVSICSSSIGYSGFLFP